MKISSEIKKVYTHLYMSEDTEGCVCCNKVFFLFRSPTYMIDT